jgi:hypothetical protein
MKGVFAERLREMGIQQEYSLPYEHEQAGVAENTNRVIIDKACTMINLSGLGMKFWPEAIRTAIFVANRSWHYGSKGIPYDKFTGCPVNVSMLCVFKSWCWARKPAEFLTGHSKFDTRAVLCRMIGYDQNGHLYRLLDISSDSVFVGTHVIFDETATGPPSSLPFTENITHTNNVNNYTDTIVTETDMGDVNVINVDNIVVQPDDDSAMSDDQYSNAEHGNGANGEEDDVDEADEEDGEEQEENIENNGEVNEMPALCRSARVSQPVRQWWMVDTRNPVKLSTMYSMSTRPQKMSSFARPPRTLNIAL